jgi:subfamily B ATP-binding cassette protein MsbA
VVRGAVFRRSPHGLSSSFGNIQRRLVAGERCLASSTPSPVRDQPDVSLLLLSADGFNTLSFGCGDAPCHDINLTIQGTAPWRWWAAAAKKRPGRLPLAPLLRPTDQLLIDGHDRGYTLHSVRDQMGIVTQEASCSTILFSATSASTPAAGRK